MPRSQVRPRKIVICHRFNSLREFIRTKLFRKVYSMNFSVRFVLPNEFSSFLWCGKRLSQFFHGKGSYDLLEQVSYLIQHFTHEHVGARISQAPRLTIATISTPRSHQFCEMTPGPPYLAGLWRSLHRSYNTRTQSNVICQKHHDVFATLAGARRIDNLQSQRGLPPSRVST